MGRCDLLQAFILRLLRCVKNDAYIHHDIDEQTLRTHERPQVAPLGIEAKRERLAGLKLGQDGAPLALKLLEKWCGKPEGPDGQPWNEVLAGWQKWYAGQYPDAPPAVLPKDAEGSHWTEQERAPEVSAAMIDFLRSLWARFATTRGTLQ